MARPVGPQHPQRLARRGASLAGILVVEPPFGHLDLVEAVWWHPARSADPALGWLRGVLKKTAAGLAAALIQGRRTRNTR